MAETTETRLENLANRAAERAAKRVRDEDTDDSFQAVPQLNTESTVDHEAEGEAVSGFDIFDFCDALQKSGKHQIKYDIKKNGEFLCARFHPYSWEQLQKDHKGGHYQVSAKSMTTKKFVKHETRSVTDPFGTVTDTGEAATTKIEATPAPQGPNFMEIFSLVNQAGEKARAEAREQAQLQSQTQAQTMTAMIQMMTSQQNQAQQMVLEIAKMTQAITEKMQASQAALVEKMEHRLERVLDKVATKEEKGLTPFELMKMNQDAQDRGYKMYSNLAALAEAKADEKLDIIEELKEELKDARGSGGGKKSMTDTVIESILPVIGTAMAQAQTAKAAVPTQQIRRAPFRGPQAIQQRARTQPRQNPVNGAGTPTAQAQANARQVATPSREASRASGGDVGTSVGTANNVNAFGLPSAGTVQAAPVAPHATRHQIEEILTPVFGQCLVERKEAPVAAEEVLGCLNAKGITRDAFLQSVSKADMMGIVKGYELPDEANPWFEEIYAYIQGRAGDVVRESTPN
jgi:hypothetical protein